MKIAHISDIHIRALKYLDEMEYTFERLYESLKEQKVDVIVVTGDVYHSKLTVTSEYFDTAYRFFYSLADIAEVVVIPGNHDLALNNVGRMDALTPVINAVKASAPRNDLVYSSYSELCYQSQKDKINFWHFSILDPKTKWPKKEFFDGSHPADCVDYVNIALYHGTINGCVYENDQVVTGNRDTLSLFDGFDYAMLGDIHKFQMLSPTIAYAGSLRQNSYGEDLEKGYLLWDIKGKNSFDVQQIILEQKRYFITLDLKDEDVPDDLPIPPDCRIRVKLHDDLTFEQEVAIKNKIKRLYKPCNDIPVLSPKTSLNVSSIKIDDQTTLVNENIRKQEIQNKLISSYLTSLDTNQDTIDKVLELDKQYHSYIDTDVLRNVTWDIKKFEWSNLFAYGEKNYISFSNLKGLVGIFGPNATGKSSMIDSICYTLFNSINKTGAIKNGSYVNCDKMEASARLTTKVDSREYTVTRKTSKKKAKNEKVIVENEVDFKFKEDKIISLNEETTPDTNKKIRKTFGSREDFNLISLIPQWKLSEFIDTRDTDRKKIFSRFLDLGIFEEKYDLASEDFKDIKKKIEELGNVDHKQKLKDFGVRRELVIEILKAKQSVVSDCLSVLSQLQEEKGRYNSISLKRPTSKEDLKKDLLKNTEELEKLKNLLFVELEENNRLKQKCEQYDELLTLISASSEQQKLLDQTKKAKLKIANLKLRTKLLKDIPCGNSYPGCSFISDAVAAKQELDDGPINERTLDLLVSQYESRLLELGEMISLRTRLESSNTSLELKDSAVSNMEERILSLLAQLDGATDDTDVVNAIAKINELTAQIKQTETKIKGMQDVVSMLNRELGSIDQNLEFYTSSLKKIAQLYEKYNIYEMYLKCMGKNGISYCVLSQKLPVINLEVNKILKQVTTFRLEVLDNEEEKKVEIFIVDTKGNKKDVELASGAEKTLASLALMTCMWSICCLPKCSTLFLDEPFGYLDDENKDNIVTMLNILKTYYKNIIVITHNQDLKIMMDSIIYINKNDEDNSECRA